MGRIDVPSNPSATNRTCCHELQPSAISPSPLRSAPPAAGYANHVLFFDSLVAPEVRSRGTFPAAGTVLAPGSRGPAFLISHRSPHRTTPSPAVPWPLPSPSSLAILTRSRARSTTSPTPSRRAGCVRVPGELHPHPSSPQSPGLQRGGRWFPAAPSHAAPSASGPAVLTVPSHTPATAGFGMGVAGAQPRDQRPRHCYHGQPGHRALQVFPGAPARHRCLGACLRKPARGLLVPRVPNRGFQPAVWGAAGMFAFLHSATALPTSSPLPIRIRSTSST